MFEVEEREEEEGEDEVEDEGDVEPFTTPDVPLLEFKLLTGSTWGSCIIGAI